MIKLKFLLLILFVFVSRSAPVSGQNNIDYNYQVVSLSITYQTYDQIKPWSKKKPAIRSANSVVVEGSLLLTTAQMVADATLIQAKKNGEPGKVPARVVHVDREINLALISVDKKGFFDDLKPVLLADELDTEGVVKSVRWKNRQLEVSSSRIRRIEVHPSRTGSVEQAYLVLMTDFTDGGWAEPVFSGTELLGLTVSQSHQDVTRVLPVETINAYLKEISGKERYTGFGTFGTLWQVNRDHAVAAWLGIEGDSYGVIIRKIPRGVTGDGILQPKDVLISLGGHRIDADGFYVHPVYGRLRFTNILMQGYRMGDTVTAKVLRKKEVLDLELEIKGFPAGLPLVPEKRSDHAPSYLVAGGLVFRELDHNLLLAFGENWKSRANPRLVTYWALERWNQTPEKRRVIVLTYALPDSYNIGYHNLRDLIVDKVNGYSINSISDMEEAFNHPENNLHNITFIRNPQRNKIVLDAVKFEEATERILGMYNIPQRIRLEEKELPDF